MAEASPAAAVADTAHPQPQAVPLPSPPFVVAPGLANLRDAGGYTIPTPAGEPSRAVRRGVLFRSADLSQAAEEAVAALRQLRIKHVFDLRSAVELRHAAHDDANDERSLETATAQLPPAWHDAERVFVPIFLDDDYSPEAIATRFANYSSGTEGFVLAYSSILEAAASPENTYAPFRTIIEHLASSSAPPSPVLIHCTAGKDRTGILIALILSVCGLDDETISQEYSLTDLGLASRRNRIVDHLIPKLGDRARAERMVTARKEYMLATLDMIRQRYGSPEKYLVQHCRVERETIERLRRNLIVETDSTEGVEAVPVDWKSPAEVVR
ncbi:protein-tyrosine phosphatase-like protein [Echria macrotheca]|uniref:Protein-tyrosine phosphatase-like protein n=1 Tax=Echria macrotheca TaxID=438768 RepID=A0AAJ0FEN0_9PEZI|nr:protein-tyrosine phosphatase-like protein [Echria macrotheca]